MKRPYQVTILGCLFIVTGLVGLAYHLSDRPIDRWIILIAAVRVIAVVGGVFCCWGTVGLVGCCWLGWPFMLE